MPTIAPLVAAWKRRARNLPGPLAGTGEASNGQPVQVEMLVSGVWVDITAYVMVRDDSGQISITSGIRDEGSQTEAGSAALELRDTDGRFSPRNPSGPYFGLIGRNTPLRISVPDGLGGKSYRLWGEVSEWAPNWDMTGTDVWTDVTVSGILRRLAQGPVPERSVIYGAVTDPLSSAVVAYWPCEDPTDSTSLASALTTGSAMTWTGAPTLASYEGFAASDPLPDLTTATLSGGIPKYDDPTATQIRFLAHIPTDGLSNGKVLCAFDQVDYSAGSPQFWELYYSTTTRSLTMRTCASDGTNLGADLAHDFDVRGRLLYISVEQQESGTGVTRALRLTDVTTGTVYSATDTATLTQLTRVTKIQFGPASRSVVGPVGSAFLPGVAVGHVTVENAVTAVDVLGARLNPIGEAAGRRVQRLCGEEGIPFGWIGDLDDTVLLGAQGRQNTLALVQEAVLADGGLLYENPMSGLGFRARSSLYNQDAALVLDYPSFNLARIPVPVEDDRYVQNKITITVGGVSASYEETGGVLSTAYPPAGVGPYGQDLTLNLSSTATATLKDHAAWRVHLGTVNEARFPQISVNLAHSSITPAMRRAILGLRLGDRIQVTNPPAWLPPDTIDQLVLGVEEQITHFEHRLTFMCAPASPYAVGVLDAASARVDNDSTLLAAVGAADTSLVVVPAVADGALWTTDTADLPFDVRVGGEVVRVTNVTPWLADTFTRSASSSWGTADTGQAWSVSGGSAVDYAVAAGVGSHTLTSLNVSRRSFTDTTIVDFDYYCDVAVSATATGGSIFGGPTGRYLDSDNLYMARLEFDTSSVVTLTIRKRIDATEGVLGTYVLPGTYTSGVYYRVRFRIQGAVLKAKAWLAASEVETPEWQITAVDGSISTTAYFGARSILSSANTNVNPVVSYDNVNVVSPQTFTVTRSINGVTKAHSAGEALSLATPVYLAL